MDWERNAKPTLEVIYQLLQDPECYDLDAMLVARKLDRPHGDVVMTVGYLQDAGYLVGENTIDQASGEITIEIEQVTEKALQQLAGWPVPGISGDAATKLLEILDQQIEVASADERPRLERFRDAVGEVGRDVLIEVLAKLVARGV